MEKKKIFILRGCRGCGATFVATGLAFALAQGAAGDTDAAAPPAASVTYLEGAAHDAGHSLPYYELSLEKNVSRRWFADFFVLKKSGAATDNRLNLYAGVNWVVRTEESPPEIALAPAEVAGRYVIWDEPVALGAAEEPDLVLFVADPLPSRAYAARARAQLCRQRYGPRVRWLMNRVPAEPHDVAAVANDAAGEPSTGANYAGGRGSQPAEPNSIGRGPQPCRPAAIRQAERILQIRTDFAIAARPFDHILQAERAGRPVPARSGADFDALAAYVLTLF